MQVSNNGLNADSSLNTLISSGEAPQLKDTICLTFPELLTEELPN